MRRRVAVSGIGVVTAAGTNPCALWESVAAERSCIGCLTRFDPSEFRSRMAAEVHDFVPPNGTHAARSSRLDRFSQFAVSAAEQALHDAGVDATALEGDGVGVYIGSALGGIAFGEEQHERFLAMGIRSVAPGLALSVFSGAGATNVSIAFGLRGPSISNANSCASGAVAIGEGFRMIREGKADVILAGGVEAPLAPLTFGSFALIKAMSANNAEPESACRPFDAARDGFVMGEGAAVLVLEEWNSARARGVRIRGELLGYATTSDAHHMTVPLPAGSEAARAMREALSDAGLDTGAVGYIQAHATGTRLGDAAESAAIISVFGPDTPPVSGTKAVHGHALGASPAIEAAITVMAMEHGHLPATVNLEQPGADCRLNHVPKGGLDTAPEFALSNAFGFGGINASLVFGPGDRPPGGGQSG
ncbi:MAG TPA: beta-ketoacyl-[acyl-carrier-protein] synthase family protein [Chloroflexota bacterium]|nr:beta-ketoacyl-[acyl-carrier-protein] synthase family protein [Chloroflexota bacterium]